LAIIALLLVAVSPLCAQVTPLDPNSNESTRDQIMRITRAPTTGPTTRQALIDEVDAKLTTIADEVKRLRGMGEAGAARADSLEQKLREFRDRREGRPAKSETPELHVVNIQGFERRDDPNLTPAQRRRQFKVTRPAVVEVQPTGRPIVIAVCAYSRVKWELRVAPGADVKRVLVGGYESQEITGVPNGIPVEIHTYEGTPRSENYFCRFGMPTPSMEVGDDVKLKTLTQLDITTLLIDRWYRGQSIVVGPGNDEWAMQRLLLDVRPVYAEAAAYKLAQQRAAVGDVRFKAVYFAPVANARPAVPIGAAVAPANAAAAARMQVLIRAGSDTKPVLADFTPAGPIEGTHVALPQRVHHVVVDPSNGAVFAMDEHELYSVDPRGGQGTRMQQDDPDLPRVSWTNGVTFDTKRGRLILSAMNMLYAIDPATKKWSGVVNLENVQAQSFTYSTAEDCFYAILVGFGQPTRLIRYTADGDPNRLIELSRRFTGETYRPDGVPQLIAVGDKLVLLSTFSRSDLIRARAGEAIPQPRQKLFVIDPQTGQVTFATTIAPQPNADVKLSEAEMSDAWLALSAEDASEVDRATAKLASAGDAAVPFIREQLKRGANVDAQAIAKLIAQLDHDDFTQRDAASRELRRMGRVTEPLLRRALDAKPSAEAKSRLEAIIAEFQPDPSGQRRGDREAVAVSILGRIGTPAAIDYLGELAGTSPDSPRAADARRALQEFTRED
jgi:hypothetical protein